MSKLLPSPVRRRAAALLGVSALALAACSDVQRAGMRGDFNEVTRLAEASGTPFASYSNADILGVCEGFVLQRLFDRAEACLDEVDRRMQIQGGMWNASSSPGAQPDSSFRFSRAWSIGMTQTARAQMEFALARYEDAAATAERVVESTDGIYTSLMPWEDEAGFGEDMEEFRNDTRVKALEVVGLSWLAMGDKQAALDAAAEISKIEFSSFYGGGASMARAQRAAQARLLLAGGQPEQAYEILAESPDADEVLGELLHTLSWISPVGILMTAATGATQESVDFYRDFQTRFVLHQAEFETGRIDAAREGYDEILAEPRLDGYGEIRRRALHGRGRIALADGDLPGAIRYFDEAIELIEVQRGSIGEERGRIGFVGASQQVYADMVSAQVRAGDPGAAFAYAERGKSRALVDMLAAKERFDSVPQAYDLLGAVRRTGQSAVAGASGTRAIADADAARDRLREANPELADLVTVPALPPAELRALIPADTTVIEYLRAGDELTAFVVTREGAQAVRIDAGALDDAAVGFYFGVSQRQPDWRTHGREVNDILIEPIRGLVKTTSVMIVPHEVLHYIPWAAIPTGSGQLLDRWDITVLPSVTALRHIERGSGSGMLAVGDPDLGDPRNALPGARVEAAEVARISGGAETLFGMQATETALRAAAPGKRVLHLATHGVFDPDAPLSSALLLTGDGVNDGRLTAAEIYDLNLDAELVTLSACRTGLGKVNEGDDVVGLIRGFLFAGAQEVLASLWLVDDAATGRLMQNFYENRGRMSDRRALQAAQKQLRAAGFDHPYYWAAFQLTGIGD